MIPLNPIPPSPSFDGFYGIVVLSILPWIALIIIRMVGARNQNATLIADRNRAFICSFFLGISDLAWGNLCIEIPDDYTMVLFFPLLSIPFLVMMFGCITRIVAYSTPSLPLIPEQACHPFQTKAATDSRAKLPPGQIAPEHMLEPPDAG